MDVKSMIGAEMQAAAAARAPLDFGGLQLKTRWHIECRDKTGKLKWVEDFTNLVVDAGLNDNLDKYLKGSAYTAAFYAGLTAGSPTVVAGDIMSSHTGWTEVVAYDQGTRPVLTLGTVAGKSVSNTASPAAFTISTNGTTIGGAFITTNSTKSGTTGTLYGAGAFSAGNKTLDDNDTLNVTITLSASAS